VSDPIAVLETAYVLTGDEPQWLNQVLDTARRDNVQSGEWVVGHTYDATRPGALQVRAFGTSGIDPSIALARGAQASLPKAADQKLPPIFRNGFVGSLRASPEALRRAGVDENQVQEFERGLDGAFRLLGIADQLWINAQDPTGIGCLLIVPRRHAGAVPPHEVRRWSYMAAHLATAFRVRRQLEGWSPDSRAKGMPGVEAILDPQGTVAHALEPAQGQPARAALGRAVKALDRARGPLRRRSPEEAIATWQAMVSGRWSLLDHFDSDGRRYVLAHRNDPRVPDARGLTLRERQVVAYAALGHSNKAIGYELGLSTSTVGSHLATARAKLALPSAAALHTRAGGDVGDSSPVGAVADSTK
jgi:DNA-binding CsgD family transcriptional regulator